jgi:hypothetical protein
MPLSSSTPFAAPGIERNCPREKSNTVRNRCNRFRPHRETHGDLRKKFHTQSTQLTERRSPLLLTTPKATVAAMKKPREYMKTHYSGLDMTKKRSGYSRRLACEGSLRPATSDLRHFRPSCRLRASRNHGFEMPCERRLLSGRRSTGGRQYAEVTTRARDLQHEG